MWKAKTNTKKTTDQYLSTKIEKKIETTFWQLLVAQTAE